MIKEIVTKDVTKIRSTYKTIAFVGAAAVVAAIIFFVLRGITHDFEKSLTVAFIVGAPISLFGFLYPSGIPLEKYVGKFYRDSVVFPKKLDYRRDLTMRDFIYQTEFTANVPKAEIEKALKASKEYKSFK